MSKVIVQALVEFTEADLFEACPQINQSEISSSEIQAILEQTIQELGEVIEESARDVIYWQWVYSLPEDKRAALIETESLSNKSGG